MRKSPMKRPLEYRPSIPYHWHPKSPNASQSGPQCMSPGRESSALRLCLIQHTILQGRTTGLHYTEARYPDPQMAGLAAFGLIICSLVQNPECLHHSSTVLDPISPVLDPMREEGKGAGPHVDEVAAAHADGDRVLAHSLHERSLVAGRHRLPRVQGHHLPAGDLKGGFEGRFDGRFEGDLKGGLKPAAIRPARRTRQP